MTLFHKALAAALLCGAVGFALPSFAADYGSNPSSTAATPAENGSTTATNTSSTPAKETKKAVRPRRTAARARVGGDEHAIVEALNQKSLEAVQTGQTPDFAAVEPATNRQAQATKVSSKAVIRHRATTKAKKGRLDSKSQLRAQVTSKRWLGRECTPVSALQLFSPRRGN